MARLRSRESREELKKMRQAWVDRLPKAINTEMREAVEKAAESVAAGQRRIVPVDKGDLRRSITVEMDERALRATVSAGGKDAYYGTFQEYGTREQPAQPFFWPVWRSRKQEIKRSLAAAFRRAFKRHGSAPT